MSLDDHCITTLILCDIFKAFDRVWHTGLLLKLKAYGVDGKILSNTLPTADSNDIGI
jgi:hypothetical protein